MEANGIGRCVISPVQPTSYHLEPENDAIAAAQSRHPERFAGLCRVDPRQGEAAVAELRRCVLNLDLKGLMLHPWEEGYTVSDAPAVRLVREAGSLGVPVFVAAGYPWVSHATQLRAVAEAAAETTIVMTHGGQINISGLAQADAFLAMEARENLLIATNGVYRQDFLEECVAAFGPERVLFATMAPVFDQGFELDRARSIGMDDRARPLILGGNTLRILQEGAETRA